MISGTGEGDALRRRDLFPFSNPLCLSFSICFHFFKPLEPFEPFETYFLGLTFDDTTLLFPQPLCTESILQSAKERHLLFNLATKVKIHPIAYPGCTRSIILSDRLHENNHRTPEKDMANSPAELPSITSEQATPLSPIWSTCPPPCPMRRRVENSKTLIATMVSSLVLGPLSVGPFVFQSRPTIRIVGPSLLPTWPRSSTFTLLSRNIFLMALYFVSMDRRHPSCLALTSKTWSCDYQSLILLVSSYWPPSIECFLESSRCLASNHP